jgi:FXSXX-COOH protein
MNSLATVDGRPVPVQDVHPEPDRTSLAQLRGTGRPALRSALRRVLRERAAGGVPVAAFQSSI